LKKQKAKKAGGASKKKDEKLDTAEVEPSASTDKIDEKPEEVPAESGEQKAPEQEETEEPAELPKTGRSHGRQPSVAVESRLRSASFYRGDGVASPISPETPSGDPVGDIYRKQAQRIEELEKENRRLSAEAEEAEKRWQKMEEELEELREGKGDVALAVERGVEVEKLVCVKSVSIISSSR